MRVRNLSQIRWPVWVILAAFIAAGASHPSAIRAFDPFGRLVRAASLTGREIAPRLSGGFAWAPLRISRRGVKSEVSDRLPLIRVAYELKKTRGSEGSPESRHALAICDLLIGDPHEAVSKLAALSGEQPLAARWSDLGAAQFVLFTRDDDPSSLAQALAAVDAALDADLSMPEARFNRALILESLGLRDEARTEWQKYLALDTGSGWAVEAREHIEALPAEEPFADRFARRYTHLLTDVGEATALARRDPQQARVAGEEEILAYWGKAILARNEAQASKHLALAKLIGSELLINGGDEMLPELVASIERANPTQRESLARAHMHFREGRELYRGRMLPEAEHTLRTASTEFAQGNSPGALMARAYMANTIYEELRVAEANVHLQQVLGAAGSRFAALRAGVWWEIGGVGLASSDWGASLRAFQESLALYERLGERNYVAILRGFIASIYSRIGQPDEAWKHRLLALRELGRMPSLRQHQALDAVTQAALADEDWAVALSFLGLDINLAERMNDLQVTIEARLTRAELNVVRNRRKAAESDLSAARRAIARLPSKADRSHNDENANAIEAMLAPTPAVAAALLTESIRFHATLGRRRHLPRLFMLRGRAYRTLGDDALAAKDFEAGVAELEANRDSLANVQDRWGIFHAADDLFGSAITLALDQDDPERAFAYAERERARGLLDALDTSWRPVIAKDIPEDTVVVEYAVHGNELVIFTLRAGNGVHAIRQRVPREMLRRHIEALNAATESSNGSGIRQSGHALYRLLLEPIERQFDGAKQIAFVPDPRLVNLPFAALRDGGGRYLVQSYALTVEPSAAVFTRLRRKALSSAARSVLIVTGSDDLGVLTFADAEARAIARTYGQVRRLSRDDATAEVFRQHALASDVIHFVGHGVASTGPRQSGYLLLQGDDAQGRLDVKQIAALRLPRTSLVVLAGCATAAGEVRSTEGTISVARAFLAAGVPSIIATLFSIADHDAARFFPRLHQHIARGLSPAEALRQTQLEWIDQGDDATAMWAAVQVIGE